MDGVTNGSTILIHILLSLVWIVAAVQDVREHKMDNTMTIGAFALALGYRIGRNVDTLYYLALAICIVVVLALFATNLFRGGDAKLLLSVLAWQPAVGTWAITLACLALIGGTIVAWSRFRGRQKHRCCIRRYPLGGVIAAAGLIVLWVA